MSVPAPLMMLPPAVQAAVDAAKKMKLSTIIPARKSGENRAQQAMGDRGQQARDAKRQGGAEPRRARAPGWGTAQAVYGFSRELLHEAVHCALLPCLPCLRLLLLPVFPPPASASPLPPSSRCPS